MSDYGWMYNKPRPFGGFYIDPDESIVQSRLDERIISLEIERDALRRQVEELLAPDEPEREPPF